MMLRNALFVYIIFGICKMHYSQDIHFSQFFNTSLYNNPAFSMLEIGLNNIHLNARQQWWYAKSPYSTFLFCYETSIKPNYMNSSFFSWSLLNYYDVAGDANLSTMRFAPALSYALILPRAFFSYFSIGIQPALVQRSFDLSKLNFDSQFDGYSYNPYSSTNEYINEQSIYFFDLNAGINYCSVYDNNGFLCGGLSVSHIFEPITSWKQNQLSRLKRKFVISTHAHLPLDDYGVISSFYYGRQGKHQEIILGFVASLKKFAFQQDAVSLYFRKNVLGGLFYRYRDAIIPYMGFQYLHYQIGITYDINISKYVPASNLRGGFEVYLSYQWKPFKRMKPQKIPCPVFF